MGWFLPSHVDQGAIFGILGLWHMFNTLQNYVRSPKDFRSMTWFPASQRLPTRLRCLELWVLLFIVVIFIFKQLSHATEDIAAGVIEFGHLQRFQHVTFALFFLVYVIVGLINENTSFLPLPRGALHCTFASGFLMELVVFHFGHHPGDDLESFVHMLMQIILLFLVLFMMLEVLWPQSILVSIASCMMLIFKGTWFTQIGLLINFPYHTPSGCSIPDGQDYPVCPTPESAMRAKSLQVLIFNWQLLGILVSTFFGYTILLHQSYRSASKRLPAPARLTIPGRVPGILTPRGGTPRKEVYFAVPEEGDANDIGSSDAEEVDAHDHTGIGGDALTASLSRRTSSRKTPRTKTEV